MKFYSLKGEFIKPGRYPGLYQFAPLGLSPLFIFPVTAFFPNLADSRFCALVAFEFCYKYFVRKFDNKVNSAVAGKNFALGISPRSAAQLLFTILCLLVVTRARQAVTDSNQQVSFLFACSIAYVNIK